MSYLDRFFNFLDTLPSAVLYLLLGVSAFVENIFPPIPGDTITAFGAFLVGAHRLDFMGVYLSTTLGSLAGFMALFWIGNLLGRKFFIEKDYRLFSAESILQAEHWFRRYGYFLILLNRFFPGIRSIISLAGRHFKTGPFQGCSVGADQCRRMEPHLDRHWVFTGEQLGSCQRKDGGHPFSIQLILFGSCGPGYSDIPAAHDPEAKAGQKKETGTEKYHFRVTASIQSKKAACPFSMGTPTTQGQT